MNLAREIATIFNRPDLPIIHDHPRPGSMDRVCSDGRKAKQILGYRPTVSLRDGLNKLKEWYLSNGKSPQELLAEEIVYNWKKDSLKPQT